MYDRIHIRTRTYTYRISEFQEPAYCDLRKRGGGRRSRVMREGGVADLWKWMHFNRTIIKLPNLPSHRAVSAIHSAFCPSPSLPPSEAAEAVTNKKCQSRMWLLPSYATYRVSSGWQRNIKLAILPSLLYPRRVCVTQTNV